MQNNKILPKKSSIFSRDVFTLVTGTTIAQIITIIASPIITRLYGPEQFGLLAIFLSISSIFGVIACFRYQDAIMLPEKDDDAANVFGLCLFFVILVGLASIPFFILFQQPLLAFLNAPSFSQFLWLIPPTIIINGVFLALNYWNIRLKHFQQLSVSRILGSISTTGTQIGFGITGYATGGGLVSAYIFGQTISALSLGIRTILDHFRFFKQKINRRTMSQVFFRYIDFPKYDTWSALLNTISWQVPIFLFSYFFTTKIVGYYSFGMMMIQLPMSLLGGSIAQVFYQRAAEAKTEGKLRPLVENIFEILVIIGLFPLLVLSLIGGDIFTVVFGIQWTEAGVYTQILSIWAFVWFLSSPISVLISVFEKQAMGLFFNILIFITRIISICVGGFFASPYIALVLFSISGIFAYGYLNLFLMKYSGINWKWIINTVLRNAIIFIPPIIIIILIKLVTENPYVIFGVSCLIGLIYYLYIFGIKFRWKIIS